MFFGVFFLFYFLWKCSSPNIPENRWWKEVIFRMLDFKVSSNELRHWGTSFLHNEILPYCSLEFRVCYFQVSLWFIWETWWVLLLSQSHKQFFWLVEGRKDANPWEAWISFFVVWQSSFWLMLQYLGEKRPFSGCSWFPFASLNTRIAHRWLQGTVPVGEHTTAATF